jgi:hypothetical protein
MLAEGGRFPQNYCAGGRVSAVYEVVTMLPPDAIGLQCSRHERDDPSQKKRAAPLSAESGAAQKHSITRAI